MNCNILFNRSQWLSDEIDLKQVARNSISVQFFITHESQVHNTNKHLLLRNEIQMEQVIKLHNIPK